MKGKSKVGILSLGCPRNLVDSEYVLGRLSARGHSIVDIDKAEIAIVNTCAFVDDAKRESIEAILDLIALKKEKKLKKIVVYGCLAQRYKDVLRRELPEIDAFVGRVSLNHSRNRFPITPRQYAYVKIAEGCVRRCSFCVIPGIKGTFRSLDMRTALETIEALDKSGISELNIIGQDITSYGLDLYGEHRLPGLLKEALKVISHARWVRLLYLYPDGITDELLEVIRNDPRICRYIDVPVQHINARVLKRMNRKTSKGDILKTIARVRSAIPGAAIRTSVIVGFPSETDKEFEELLDFIRAARFERLGAFMYSREESTPAYHFKGQVPEKVKQERFNTLMQAQQEISKEYNRQFLGNTIEVIIDEKTKDGYIGRSQYDAPEVDGTVYVRSKKALRPGDFARVRVIDTLEYDLVAEAFL